MIHSVDNEKLAEEIEKQAAKHDVIMDVLCEYGVKRCYYGHIHGKNSFRLCHEGEYRGVELRLISCDRVGFMPVLIKA